MLQKSRNLFLNFSLLCFRMGQIFPSLTRRWLKIAFKLVCFSRRFGCKLRHFCYSWSYGNWRVFSSLESGRFSVHSRFTIIMFTWLSLLKKVQVWSLFMVNFYFMLHSLMNKRKVVGNEIIRGDRRGDLILRNVHCYLVGAASSRCLVDPGFTNLTLLGCWDPKLALKAIGLWIKIKAQNFASQVLSKHIFKIWRKKVRKKVSLFITRAL